MKRKNVILMAVFLVVTYAGSSFAVAAVSIHQVQKNVENLWKPLKESLPSVTAKEFKKIKDSGEKFILVDTRRKEEYDAAHLPDAIHIDRGVLEWAGPKKLKETDVTIYVYCRTGARGALVTQRLITMGYTNTINIYDAFKGWVMEGYPVYNRHGEFKLSTDAFEKIESEKS